MNAGVGLFYTFLGFSCIAGLTWFFSNRPRLFVRTFVPREHWREVWRQIRSEPNFSRGMRVVALLQFCVAVIIGLVALWLLVRS